MERIVTCEACSGLGSKLPGRPNGQFTICPKCNGNGYFKVKDGKDGEENE